MDRATNYDSLEGIAIIGMSGRFPGAKNVEEFWQNLRDGVESISVFTNEELIDAGIAPGLLDNPNHVKAGAVLEDVEFFDASFFGFNPKEAEMTDPQHRIFLECAWEALENAGYDTQRCESRIGVYAGASLNNYLSFNLNRDQIGSADSFQKLIGNDKDFLTTRVSYKLNLKGPSLTVQTACSTSLVATTLACQSLLNYQCDMALAGGVSIRVPQKTGYLYQEGGILSPDGHCRAFDADAQGTIIGNGVGVVVLKRLEDAIADGDRIHAVIKGSAINNDGSEKVGYTAPSVNGQADAIAEAIALAGVDPETITYIETHGTGTRLGDPIEITALSNVFGANTEKKNFCAIGSVKTNIGHLDAAAGVTGLMKTVLALKHKLIPPSLNFKQPNPEIDFANSPFYVNTQLTEWKANATPRRAGVSSLGIGGTNAHVVLEEAPTVKASSSSRPWQLLVLSAKTESALETATANLAAHLKQHPDLNLADVAYTLQVGRRAFEHRRILVCQTVEELVNQLETPHPQKVLTHFQEPTERSIAFMFPGQGAQYVDMGRELYQTEPIFREQVDRCAALLQPHIGMDLRSLLYPNQPNPEAAAEKLKQTCFAQPALFAIEYALAQLWMSWGISPQAMLGHSIGEYVAACFAGVMSVEDALALVAIRGRLMQQMPAGAMLAVSLPEAEV
ncbi:type I polyketide synthase, partial [Coleofasciculus sp. FACHB-712]|uniref:type I polyketide synthase n=1 Tax=Coleofasciculus sp. FACHB-712 TaxID=2692789 RepID=UPI001689DB58